MVYVSPVAPSAFAFGQEEAGPLDPITAAFEAGMRKRLAEMRGRMLTWGLLGVLVGSALLGATAGAAFKLSGARRSLLPGVVFGGVSALVGTTGVLLTRSQLTLENLRAPNESTMFFTVGLIAGR